LAVSPSIFFIIGDYTIKLEKFHKSVIYQYTVYRNQRFSIKCTDYKIFPLLREIYIDIFPQMSENINIG
jgi:hypothetical protein